MDYEINFIKNSDFKTVQGNGVFGGLTNTGQINLNFYTDRAPIPQKITLDIDPKDGNIKGESGRESKEGIIREVHFGVLMDINTAKSVVEWLQEKISKLEQATQKDNL